MRHTIIIMASLALTACSSGTMTGAVEIGLSQGSGDVTTYNFSGDDRGDLTSAIVTVKEIDLFVPGQGWIPIMITPRQIDLLQLDGKSISSLGVTQLPVGKACKLRLVLDDSNNTAHVVLKNGQQRPLEIPDHGVVTVTGDLDFEPCASGTVIVDFDAKFKSEHNGSEYELGCHAHVKTAQMKGACGPDAGHGGDAGHGSDGGTSGGDGGSNTCNGIVCAPGETCVNGMCQADPCTGVVCAPGETCKNGMCVANDPCAGIVCPTGETCSNGVCQKPAPMDGGCPNMHH